VRRERERELRDAGVDAGGADGGESAGEDKYDLKKQAAVVAVFCGSGVFLVRAKPAAGQSARTRKE